jgi:ribose/xylose/arabinose/galactoside ABC-type transport system permease subunit
MTLSRSFIGSIILEIILVLLCTALALTAPGFLTTENLLNVLRNISMQGLIALGMTMVIIAGEIDLSVGSMVAFAGCMTAFVTEWLARDAGIPFPPAIAAATACTLIIALALGSCTGILRTRYGVPSFITTLALLTGLSGTAELITNGFPLTPFPDWYNFLGGGYVFGIPFPALLFVLVFLIVHVVMNHTSFGRSVYAVGGNAEAARLSGINVSFTKIAVLAITDLTSLVYL